MPTQASGGYPELGHSPHTTLLPFMNWLSMSRSMLFSSAPAPQGSTAKCPPSLSGFHILKVHGKMWGSRSGMVCMGSLPALTSRPQCWSQHGGCCGWYPYAPGPTANAGCRKYRVSGLSRSWRARKGLAGWNLYGQAKPRSKGARLQDRIPEHPTGCCRT